MGSRSYRQACSVAKALDLVGERWTLLLIRDLLVGPQGYNALLSGLPGLTTNLLAKRLKSLAEQGLIEKVPAQPGAKSKSLYGLTAAGQALGPVLQCLSEWGQEHGPAPEATDQFNVRLLLIILARHYVQTGQRWIVQVGSDDVHLQFRLGGEAFEGVEGAPMRPDLVVQAKPLALRELLFGEEPFDSMIASGDLILSGPAPDLRAIWADFVASFQLTRSSSS